MLISSYGVISHQAETERWIKRTIDSLISQRINPEKAVALLNAADRLANAAMWLVAHQAYACRVNLNGSPLNSEDFKVHPQGHVGGSLNMVVAYVGYLLANALSGITRG